MKYLILGLCFFYFLTGCQSTKSQHQENVEKKLQSHHQIVKQKTAKKKVYSGLQSAFEYSATLMTEKVVDSEWQLKKAIYKWNEDELKTEMKSFEKKNGENVQVFLSFFTPVRKQNNLEKKNSKWSVFLLVDGKKYTGDPKKRRDLFDDIAAFFPNHTTWSKPYLVNFPLEKSMIDNKEVKFLITGPVGSGEITF